MSTHYSEFLEFLLAKSENVEGRKFTDVEMDAYITEFCNSPQFFYVDLHLRFSDGRYTIR